MDTSIRRYWHDR